MAKTPPKANKLPTAAKSPNKVTKNETAFAKQYAKAAQTARQKVDIKGGVTTRAQAKAIKAAREQLAAMKQTIAKKGYGTVSSTPNKRGGYSSQGIYKELTGKPLPPRKKPPKPAKPTKKPTTGNISIPSTGRK